MANVEQQEFGVFVSDYSSSVAEWRRASEVPASELPELTGSQKEVAQKFGISPEEYARGVLVGQYGEERLHGRALRLGRIVAEILTGLGSDYKLEAVIAEMIKTRWLLRVSTPAGVAPVHVPRELADDILDSGANEEIEKLRVRLLSGLKHTELMAKDE